MAVPALARVLVANLRFINAAAEGNLFGMGYLRQGVGGRGPKFAGIDVQMELLNDLKMARIIEQLKQTVARRVMTAGAAKGAQVVNKKLRAQVPSRHPKIKHAMSWRRLRAREWPGGGAKVGGRVGRGSRSRAARTSKGVGIGANNIHWWIMGATGAKPRGGQKGPPRRHRSGKSTGIMPAQTDPVWKIARDNRSAVRRAWLRGSAVQLRKEVRKVALRGSSLSMRAAFTHMGVGKITKGAA